MRCGVVYFLSTISNLFIFLPPVPSSLRFPPRFSISTFTTLKGWQSIGLLVTCIFLTVRPKSLDASRLYLVMDGREECFSQTWGKLDQWLSTYWVGELISVVTCAFPHLCCGFKEPLQKLAFQPTLWLSSSMVIINWCVRYGAWTTIWGYNCTLGYRSQKKNKPCLQKKKKKWQQQVKK